MKLVTYDAVKIIGMPTDYSDTLLNFVKEYRHKVKDLQDINWVACKFLDEDTRNYYTWWCVNEVRHLMKDERSIKAVDTLKLYIDGKASIEELEVAADNANIAYTASLDINYFGNCYVANAAYGAIIAAVQDDCFSATVTANAVANVANAVDYDVDDADADAKTKHSNLQIDKLIKILENK
jgi:hypothetical protein